MKKMENILKIYGDWALEIFGEEVEMKWCTDFGCYPQIREAWLIEIGMLATESDEDDLPNFFQTNFICNWNFEEIDYFTLCFLHECGHLYTWDFLTEDEQDNREIGYISWEDYRNLPSEYAADDWANDYLNNSRERWEYWQEKLEIAYSEVTEKDLEYFAQSA